MGLDWQLVAPPRPGSALDFLEAPRIGIDAEATEWLRRQWDENPSGADSFEELLAKSHGQAVLELARHQDGVPGIGSFSGPLDFRGQALTRVETVLDDDDLLDEAWNDHSAEEMLEYAGRLAAALRTFRDANPGEAADEVQVVESTIRWLRFWGERGFSFHAWF